jgi:hypothetical protein
VLIRRRDVRLRERRIGPYKYPTVDKEQEEKINPKIKPKNRANHIKETEHKPKIYIYTQRMRERQRRVTDQLCHCLRPCKKKRKPVKNNPEHREEERKAEEQPLSSFLQKKNNPEISQNKSNKR